MKVETSKYINLNHTKISLPFGNFYFFENFMISEIDEGVHFTWDQAQLVLELAQKHYGINAKIDYISNRIYSYSLHAQDWLKFFNNYNNINSLAIVTYSKIGFMNIMLEKIFLKVSVKKFQSLENAIDWVMQPKLKHMIK